MEVFGAPHCDGFLFTAYDPPRALMAVAAVAPPIPLSNSKAHTSILGSSLTLDPLTQATIHPKASIPVPASTPRIDQPKATITNSPAPSRGVEPIHRLQSNHPTTQRGPPSQAPTETVQPNGDLKGKNSPQKKNDPKQGNGLSQASDPESQQDGDVAHGKDFKQASDPNQANDPKPRTSDITKSTNSKQGSDSNEILGQGAVS